VETTKDRAEADRHTHYKFLDVQTLFAYNNVQRNEEQPSNEQHGIGTGRRFSCRTNKGRKGYKISEDEGFSKKQEKLLPAYQNPRPVAMNKLFAPLRDLPMKNGETYSTGNATKTPETNESMAKLRSLHIVLTSKVKLISLQRKIK
jgi:hypothetical protein